VGLLKISPYQGSIGVMKGQGIGIYDKVKQYLRLMLVEWWR
jgi:hypothetical protein